MTLIDYTLLSVGIASTLVSVMLVVTLIVGFSIVKRLYKIMDQLEAMSQTGLEATQSLKQFVDTSTHRVEAFVQTFLTLHGAKEVVQRISETVNQLRKSKPKAAKSGEGVSHEPKS